MPAACVYKATPEYSSGAGGAEQCLKTVMANMAKVQGPPGCPMTEFSCNCHARVGCKTTDSYQYHTRLAVVVPTAFAAPGAADVTATIAKSLAMLQVAQVSESLALHCGRST